MLQLLALASSTIRTGFTLLLRISTCSKRKAQFKVLASNNNFFFRPACLKYLPLTRQSLWIPSEYYQECWSALENNSFPISKFSLIAPLAWTRCCCISCLHFTIKREDTSIKGIIMKSADKNKKWIFFFFFAILSPVEWSASSCLDYLLNNVRYLLFYTTLLHTRFNISRKCKQWFLTRL